MTDSPAADPAVAVLALRFLESHPVDAARVMEGFGGDLASRVLSHLPIVVASPVIRALAGDVGADCLSHFDPEHGAEVLEDLDLDEAAALLRRMDEGPRDRLLGRLPSDRAALMRRVLDYPGGSAGALMDPKVLSVRDSLTAGKALAHVRAAPELALYYLYLVDEDSRLSGVVNLRELMLATPETPLAEFMATGVDRLPATADRMAILAHPGWTEYHALPVVDSDDRFVGAVRYETLRRLDGQSKAASPTTTLAASLGELYWLGMSGMIQGLGNAVQRTEGSPEPREAPDAG